jgi:hypothetical protein
MTTPIPKELQVAKLNIEAAYLALESLFERMQVTPRADEAIVTDTVHEACFRLKAANELLSQLEIGPLAGDGA